MGVVDDETVRSATGGNAHLPVFPLSVRALNVLSHEAVDNVLFGAPAAPTAEFFEAQGVAIVAVDGRDHAARETAALGGASGVHSHAMPKSLDARGASRPHCRGARRRRRTRRAGCARARGPNRVEPRGVRLTTQHF